ncbi:MAG: hypothetical protein DSO07_03190 [Thermoproteota archaeon]|jgi:hypothetical protein|nr:MAG: hypothetical protein DSO07_03190 [Candidatus Korarchaeota archaeon]
MSLWENVILWEYITPNTGLIIAVYQRDLEKVKELLDRGADVNAKDIFGDTPLHIAARNGHLDIVKLLLERGADVNARNESGDTPLTAAAANGHLDVVRFLVNRGADIDARNDSDCTPLHIAAIRGHLNVVKFLVEKGADVNARDEKGETPLDLAKDERQWDVVYFLEKIMKKPVKIVDVRCNSLYEGLWGRILISMEGEGTVKVDLEGDVDWIDPGEIIINGEDTVEIPVKPKIRGDVPVKITVKGGEKPISKIVWLDVADISEQIKARPADSVLWVEEEIERIKGFLMEIEES